PEQISSADTAGPSADLYTVTAVLYELLMEVVPRGSPGSLSAQRPDLPPALEGVIEKGLKDRPRSRYQGAKEYLAALDAMDATRTDGPRVEGKIAKPPAPNPTNQSGRLMDSAVLRSSGALAVRGIVAL